MRTWRRESALDLYNLVLGAVLLASPWLFTLTNTTARIDLWASSAAVIVISLAAIAAFAKWEEWANLILGIWLITSPWILGFAHTRAMHFSVGIGLAITGEEHAFLAIPCDEQHADSEGCEDDAGLVSGVTSTEPAPASIGPALMGRTIPTLGRQFGGVPDSIRFRRFPGHGFPNPGTGPAR